MSDNAVRSVRVRGCVYATLAIGLLVALILVFHFGVIQGVILPVRVAEGSMAPSLVGEHYRQRCDNCRRGFDFDIAGISPGTTVVCPHCGSAQPARSLIPLGGDRVWIHRWSRALGAVRRWDAVAARDVRQPARLLVKRVAGLPGERVDIRHGDVLIDGKRAPKSLAQFRSLAIVVSDETYAASPGGAHASAWSTSAAAWQLGPRGWRCRQAAGNGHAWLTFTPPSRHDRAVGAAILDDCSYNQTVSRRLNVVRDLLVCCEFVPQRVDEIAFRFTATHHDWMVGWQIAQRTVSIAVDTQTLMTRKLVVPSAATIARFEIGMFDGQFVLALNGTTVMRLRDERLAASSDRSTPELSLGLRRGVTLVRRLCVARDIYYLGPAENPLLELPRQLGSGEFFLLGDNSPISIDSRQLGPVPDAAVIGTVSLAASTRADR